MLGDKEKLKRLRENIKLLIQYAVPAAEQATAVEFLEYFEEDPFALDVIRAFYSTLPEAREEALIRISVLEEKEQVYLLLLSSANHQYYYLASSEEGLFTGEWEQGVQDKDVLVFFGYQNQETFNKKHPSPESCREYIPLERANEEICPSCGVQSGALHTLGCPVEVCPWCSGQLNHCNCRFEQLGVDELTDETRLGELEEKLKKKGRVPYAKEQRPTFMKEEGALE